MVRVYIEQNGAPLHLPMSLVFWPNFKFEISPKRLFLRGIMEAYQKPFVEIAESPESADFFAIPFEYFFVEKYAPAYLSSIYDAARRAGKKVLLFDYTDFVDRTPRLPPHAIFFRVSVYRHHQTPQEIVMPYFVEDLGKTISLHQNKPECATVGFCGLSRYGSRVQALKAWVKRRGFRSLLALRGDAAPSVHAGGIVWRRCSLRAIRQSSAIETNIIERSSYSLHRDSVSGDPQRVRAEYLLNMQSASLPLCVRGDANASQRFYEALSAGRVPLLLDTDCVLPLEGVAPYEKCVIRVPHNETPQLPERAARWHVAQSPVSFIEAEREAKALFQDFLRLDRYFEIVFDREQSPYKRILYER
ncbi:MAG: hypothetical protein A3H73_01395 [Candidatus Taylorbacteria bacterium RIFCSPLOWO2_02_FULL_50_120]|nr:MAG: Glycosyl transferase exostosin family [Parcubacteria group bacterium GW2011_GWF2_50_9]OHA35930.1 MAG: hypothetical protein A3B27_01780 [Candidatus Taylorbacteria bacterium RIFCSPLOWO2_01_FULL_50_130]OHA40402.1 MAG: hypothetical protein A3H73_01395 [Candidatus Taylorbacteria bacterium RIFCSPLOWO2_02_FULL_50_120]HCB35634.1 hypothetical protein [Candidatus Taylorbacteria bacterium]